MWRTMRHCYNTFIFLQIPHNGHSVTRPLSFHDDVVKWKHFPRYWSFVRGIHRWPVNSPHKGQWRGALLLSLICTWIHGWVNNREAGDLRRHHAHDDVTVMCEFEVWLTFCHCYRNTVCSTVINVDRVITALDCMYPYLRGNLQWHWNERS